MANGSARKEKVRAYRRGFYAEYKAALYLAFCGYRIVALRYRTVAGEIDIIARKKDLAAFIEVKARRSREQALFAVAGGSQQRIRAASLIWLSKQKDAAQLSQRYDIVAVTPWRLPMHYKDAF